MKAGKVLSIAIFSALLAACSSSSGGNGIRAEGPPSIDQIPEKDKSTVLKEKAYDHVYDDYNGNTYRYTLDGKTDDYNFSNLADGRTDLPVSLSYESTQGDKATRAGTMLVYQQPYSVVTGITWTQGSGDLKYEEIGSFKVDQTLGMSTTFPTLTALVTDKASFNYTGAAFDGGKEQGILSYTMDFGSQEGHGSISGFSRTGLIELRATQLNNNWSIYGTADIAKDSQRNSAQYYLSFFGPNAEEIVGEVYNNMSNGLLDNSEIIFAGKR